MVKKDDSEVKVENFLAAFAADVHNFISIKEIHMGGTLTPKTPIIAKDMTFISRPKTSR